MDEQQSSGSVSNSKIVESRDRRWEQLTAHGNDAVAEGNYEQASQLYEAALKEAHERLGLALGGVENDAIPILIISYHNAAENEQKRGRREKALEHYRSAFEHVISTADSASASPALREVCLRNLTQTLTPLISLLQDLSESDQIIEALIERARRVALTPGGVTSDTLASENTGQ